GVLGGVIGNHLIDNRENRNQRRERRCTEGGGNWANRMCSCAARGQTFVWNGTHCINIGIEGPSVQQQTVINNVINIGREFENQTGNTVNRIDRENNFDPRQTFGSSVAAYTRNVNAAVAALPANDPLRPVIFTGRDGKIAGQQQRIDDATEDRGSVGGGAGVAAVGGAIGNVVGGGGNNAGSGLNLQGIGNLAERGLSGLGTDGQSGFQQAAQGLLNR
ncbi:MAG: hypothetical protein FWC83_02015, partial [Alphaproteobacteria bacterium]|nr:hypothetical protein [Alphaproteobacteria bacterium]